MSNLIKSLQPDTKKILDEIYQVSEKHNIKIYVVGGFVRDLILKRPGKDIDFVVIGDAIEFALNVHKFKNQ